MKCPHCSETVDAVPRERLNAKTERIAELEAQLSDATSKASDADKLTKRIQRLEAERDKLAIEYEQHKARAASDAELMRHGVTDPEDMELVRWRHSRIEGAPDFAEWLGGPAREDRLTAHLFAAPESSANDAAPSPAGSGTPMPRSNAGTVPDQPAPAPSYTPQDIATMSIDELRAARKAGHV